MLGAAFLSPRAPTMAPMRATLVLAMSSAGIAPPVKAASPGACLLLSEPIVPISGVKQLAPEREEEEALADDHAARDALLVTTCSQCRRWRFLYG